MAELKVLDASLLKDLLNHIYEKRKATAFQIEGITKSALARNDSNMITLIIAKLTELANGGSVSAKLGAITALGSVSVALGSFAIAFFLQDIVRPIFATFRDKDARVRYYACESLYNISKIARGEILLYFNEIFDILCILVTDTESSVKNAADILDRLIKDIVCAKSTNYVSILHQQNEDYREIESNITRPDGVSVQVNNPQDPQKAFLLPKFIPTLLERMYTIEPFAKKFLLGWLELFDDIPSSELITFLPNFLEPLICFLMNKCPLDVRVETQNLLNIFLKEIRSIYQVKFNVKKEQILKERKRKVAEQQSELNATPSMVENSGTDPADILSGLKLSSVELKNSQSESDAISIKSTSTTIIRKPSDHRDPKDVIGTEETSSQNFDEDNSFFVNGQDIFINFSQIIEILLSFLKTPSTGRTLGPVGSDLGTESNNIRLEIQSIVLKWLQEIITISPISFSKFIPDCVSIILQNIALTDDHKDFELRNQLLDFDRSLRTYLVRLNECISEKADEDTSNWETEVSQNTIQGFNKESYDEFLELYLMKTITAVRDECLLSVNEFSRLTNLDWLMFLYSNYQSSFFRQEEESPPTSNTFDSKFSLDLTKLLNCPIEASNEVISKILTLAAQISEDNQDFFRDFMAKLIMLFETDRTETATAPSLYNSNMGNSGSSTLSKSKVEFIIRRLCVSISSEKIFQSLSEVLVSMEESNSAFIGRIVVTLNNILLTSPELQDLRKKLKSLDFYKADDWLLFSSLFQSWCHNSPSAISLCLLTSNYELSYLIIKSLADVEVTFEMLTQLDILVQLLESHIFLKLRLQLLEPEKYPYLFKTLYGILMIMPQSSTYATLNNRLNSLTLFAQSSLGILQPNFGSLVSTPGTVGTGASPNTSQLSTRRKRINEMAEKFMNVTDQRDKSDSERIQREFIEDGGKVTGVKLGAPPALVSGDSKPLVNDYFSLNEKSVPIYKRG